MSYFSPRKRLHIFILETPVLYTSYFMETVIVNIVGMRFGCRLPVGQAVPILCWTDCSPDNRKPGK